MKTEGVTGRDGYIVAQALHMAIKWIDAQPEEERELSNQADMRAILNARFASMAASFALEDDLKEALRLGFRPELGRNITHEEVCEFLTSAPDKNDQD